MTSLTLGSGEVVEPMLSRKASQPALLVTVPQTDTGRQVEHTKAHERTVVKELSNLTP
jgi:hypothetical protein